MPRYEDDYPRRRVEDPRHAPISSRGEDRLRDNRGEVRRERVVEDRLDTAERRIDPRVERERAERERVERERVDLDRMPIAGRDPRDRQANAGVRREPIQERGADPRRRAVEELPPQMYRDPRTGQVYAYDEPPVRGQYPADDMMRDDPPPRRRAEREVVDYDMRDNDDDYGNRANSKYNDYFVENTGIDREVIQHEICRYLGNDATVRPYTNKDGRKGYLVRAYRALTSAMIDDLKRDTARWRQEQDRRVRQGRTIGTYQDMKGRQEPDFHNEPMDVDMADDGYQPPASRYGRDPRELRDPDPRGGGAGRHAVAPAPAYTGFPPEPNVPAYALASDRTGNYGPESLPRTYPGNTTPPNTGRTAVAGYSQPGYQPTGRATAPPSNPPTKAYRDPRTGQLVGDYGGGYPPERGARHR